MKRNVLFDDHLLNSKQKGEWWLNKKQWSEFNKVIREIFFLFGM